MMCKIRLILKKRWGITALILILFTFMICTGFMMQTHTDPNGWSGFLYAMPLFLPLFVVFVLCGRVCGFAASAAITGALAPVMLFAVISWTVFVFCDISTTPIDDPAKYEQVMQMNGAPRNDIIRFFPSKIPQNATDITFHYNPPFLQGAQNYLLVFTADSITIDGYARSLAVKAQWVGTHKQALTYDDVFSWHDFGHSISDGYFIYLMCSETYKPDDWNHGTISLAAINKTTNTVVFSSGAW